MQSGIGDKTQRIDNRCSIHPKRHQRAEHIGEVTIFSGQGCDNESESHRYTSQDDDDDREEKQIPVGAEVHTLSHKNKIDDDESSQLQREAEELGADHRHRRDKTREIDLAIKSGIGLESGRYSRKACREILPKANTAKIEDRLRYIVCGDISDTAKHDHIHHHREKR